VCYTRITRWFDFSIRRRLVTLLQFTDLFTQTPGDFFYHVVVILSLATGLMIAYGQRTKHPQSHTGSVYGAGLLGATIAWTLIIVGALFSAFIDQPTIALLPPLERAVNVTTILTVGWAFLTADDRNWGNTPGLVLLGLVGVVVVGYVLTGVQWIQLADQTDFNLTLYNVTWSIAQVVVALCGVLVMILYFQRIIDAPLKLVFFLILLAGYGTALWFTATGQTIGHYQGFARLGLFAAVPIIPYVIYRKVIYGYELAFEMQRTTAAPPAVELKPAPEAKAVVAQPLSDSHAPPQSSPVERESVQLLRTLGLILEETEPSEIPTRIVRASVEVLKADVGALLSVKDANYADIAVAYDHAMRRPIPAMLSLNLEQQMTLANAIDRRQQRPLFVDRNLSELEDLYSRLDVPQIGPAYFQPLMKDSELVAVLIIALPYAKRELRDAERELLKGIGIISGSLLSLSYAADTAKTRAEERAIQAMVSGIPLDEITDADILQTQKEMQDALEAAKIQNQSLQKEAAKLRIELDDQRTRLTQLLGDTEQGLSVTQRIVVLSDEHDRLRNERDQLAQRLQQAETTLAGATGTDNEALFRAQIETLNREKRDLTDELNLLRSQLEEMSSVQEDTPPQGIESMLNAMSEANERLQAGRQDLTIRLDDIQDQLIALGIDTEEMGFGQLVQQLYDQRSKLQARTEALKLERDALLNERRRFEQRIRKEEERETQIETMESEIRHLATDREAITRQRDALRQERNELQIKVDKIKEQRARLLADLSVHEDDIRIIQEQLESVRHDFEQLTDESQGSLAERDRLRAENRSLASERDKLLARVEGNRERLQQISDDAQRELREMINEITAQRSELLNDIKAANKRIQELEAREPVVAAQPQQMNGRPANPELMMSMVDSLRTPMTSVMGYVDLLVSESAGILSEMQRKFVQRISANVVRLETMLNDLSHITALDTGMYQLKLERTDIIGLVEDSLTSATHQFREKDLTLHIQLDDTIPDVNLDPNAMTQVIGQLLTNAYLVSPAETTVEVQVARTGDADEDNIQIAIVDSGGGIPEDDQSEVFARRYRTEHQLIQGIGDTGIGLSIAKALVEAHHGQMVFETQIGQGTTFIVTLPTTLEPIEA
jgi:signal transduction histidine kinase/uncharacterized membrane protein